MRQWRALALVLVVVALAGCSGVHSEAGSKHPSAPPSPRASATPSQTPSGTPTASPYPEAAARYVGIAVPLNKAIWNEDAAGDDSWQEFVYYAPATRNEYLAAVKQLGAPSSWPRPVQAAVARMEADLTASAKVLDAISHATSNAQVVRIDHGDDNSIVDRQSAGAIICNVLDITDPDAAAS